MLNSDMKINFAHFSQVSRYECSNQVTPRLYRPEGVRAGGGRGVTVEMNGIVSLYKKRLEINLYIL